MMRTRHRWQQRSTEWETCTKCIHCGTTREIIATVGIRYHRELKSYVRPDGVRFTGMAPTCEPTGK